MQHCRRRQYMVDQPVQGALMFRAVGYWFFCLLSVVMMLVCWTVFTDPPRSSGELFSQVWHKYAPAIGATVLVLPIIVIDLMRMSNRFVGPIYRLRNSLRQLIEGEHVRPIVLRDKDYWKDFADDFNQVLAMVQPEQEDSESDDNSEQDSLQAVAATADESEH